MYDKNYFGLKRNNKITCFHFEKVRKGIQYCQDKYNYFLKKATQRNLKQPIKNIVNSKVNKLREEIDTVSFCVDHILTVVRNYL